VWIAVGSVRIIEDFVISLSLVRVLTVAIRRRLMRPTVARPAANALPTEVAQGLRSIVHSNVRVLHRGADIGMPGEFPGFGQ
jgi:hypothetical protein